MSLEKICNLYASDFHFCTMLVPYVNKNMNEGREVINIFENDLEKDIKIIIEQTKLENASKANLSKIEWKKKETNINLEEVLRKFANEKEKIIFINGEKKYIDKMDRYVEKWINANGLEDKNIKIVHCYNIETIKNNINDIVNLYSKILNTTGEHTIKKVYSYI